jgi:hypothetical protein
MVDVCDFDIRLAYPANRLVFRVSKYSLPGDIAGRLGRSVHHPMPKPSCRRIAPTQPC